MNEEDIQDNPSLKELRENADQFRAIKGWWPILRPLARMLGADVESLGELLDKGMRLAEQVDEMSLVPDTFNDLFSERGWILFDSMELETAEHAIELAQKQGVDQAEVYLVEHFSPDWVEKRIYWLAHIAGFHERFPLAQLALEDYKAGRFYASILVTLSLIDGWVNELNIVDFQRLGFFSEKSQLVAWDSIAAHPKGLVKLQRLFSKSRMMTRSEEITIPYRNGILHGMDLGYNNRYVAAKSWAALFAVRDWAIKCARDELNPPVMEPEAEKTLWESLESYWNTKRETEKIKQWKPRQVTVGESVPTNGEAQDYPPNTPERKAVEFLHYWRQRNYGYMAKCFAPMLSWQPVDVREVFEKGQLVGFALVDVNDVSPFTCDVKADLLLKMEDDERHSVYEFRVILNNDQNELAYIQNADTVWGIATWRIDQ